MTPAVRLVVLGTPGSKRARGLLAASERVGWPGAPVWVPWLDWLREPATLERHLAATGPSGCLLRLEPPGDEPGTHDLLSGAAAPRLHGELADMDRWFAGFHDALTRLMHTLAEHPHVQVWNHPVDILRMTDKLACQQALIAGAVPVPALHGTVDSYDHLRELVTRHGLHAVFVKARYGSSAAGVVAYRHTHQGQEQAISGAHLVEGRLINSKRLRTLTRHDEIRPLINALARQGLYAETWIPKPRHGAGHFDLRVLTLDGEPVHRIARLSRQVMTNLHLDAQRVAVDDVLSPDDQTRLTECARQAAGCFPGARMIGFDIVMRHGGAPRVLEANAFGDLLPGLLWRGDDPHELALRHLLRFPERLM